MNARKRRVEILRDSSVALARWQQAIRLRAEWLSHGLSCEPAERDAAQAAITKLYALIDAKPPEFVWVDSPAKAYELLAGRADAPIDLTSPMWTQSDMQPVAIRLASLQGQLRHRLEQRTGSSLDPPWSATGSSALARDHPEEALRTGVRLPEVLDVGVLDALRLSLRDGLAVPLRAKLGRGSNLLGWRGQHDAPWVAHFDIRRRLGMALLGPEEAAQLEMWAQIVRSCGWWWPLADICVVAERTSAVSVETSAASRHGEVRLHNATGPAVRFADGWALHAWHGTVVPAWVIEDPAVERILAERNVEVRRCAIERIGWQAYLDRAGLDLIAAAPDPGNPGCDLRLYDLPPQLWGTPARLLLAVNGSVERDGHRRRYGLTVPADLDDPVAAAGWSYGLTAHQYRQLLRRT
ncbi:hypothetical protein Rhe02_02130 [Rhizocola hellebori]|uniref:DUF6745 domain-containing protein n=1 Tax=Rhizocola hellebori TaxID=1392758 RepID=A0A8J3Q1Z0_9ACTN|nr:hypothetical protein [Rhizocola hellebori]GIH02146.1 hypothetical protein Rhe02_02130 [Rhizocola hellebori]